ncbi:MAG: NAD(P)/FAD-dependent oxidoreductase [Bacteroidota bacterium]
MPHYDIIIIGGGAAGFFSAVNAANFFPNKSIAILEKSSKFLSKVKVSGGGRCNATNATFEVKQLLQNYPRGNKELINTFSQFNSKDTIEWFAKRNVKLVAEPDGRMFPSTNSSQTIIDCLLNECVKHKIGIITNTDVIAVTKNKELFELKLRNPDSNRDKNYTCKKLVITSGGNSNTESYNWLREIGHSITPPIASLFTFNLKDKTICNLMGLSVTNASIKINESKLNYSGPLLITHWGFSGPAILKLSAFGAQFLHDKNYQYKVTVNWLGDVSEKELRDELNQIKEIDKFKKIHGFCPFNFPKRLWEYFLIESKIDSDLTWANVSNKQLNSLIQQLLFNTFECNGKTTFKEEFVTCGGIKRTEIDFKTMQSKLVPNLFFAGEVIDVDGITGGFNFQAAWSTGFVAAKSLF